MVNNSQEWNNIQWPYIYHLYQENQFIKYPVNKIPIRYPLSEKDEHSLVGIAIRNRNEFICIRLTQLFMLMCLFIPSIADGKPKCEIHPLGIGGNADPVRLVFNSAAGPAINASIVDMGNRFRLIVNEVEAVEAKHDLPKLPVARVLWQPLTDIRTGCAAWIYAGGAPHTGYSQNLTREHMEDFASFANIEYVVIGKDTNLYQLKNELRWNEA